MKTPGEFPASELVFASRCQRRHVFSRLFSPLAQNAERRQDRLKDSPDGDLHGERVLFDQKGESLIP